MKKFTFTELDNLAGGTFTDDYGRTWSVHKRTGKCFEQKRMDKRGRKPWVETGETYTFFKVCQRGGNPAGTLPSGKKVMFNTNFEFRHNGNETRRVR